MIGKVFLTGRTFGQTCEYLCKRQAHTQVLVAEGVWSHDYRLMAADFEWQHRLMPEKEKPVFHSVLSFPHGESLSDERLAEIGRKYMEKIDMAHTQYAFIKHTDKEHLHVHVIANRVDNDGKPTGEGLVIERSMKAARALTEEYGLRQEQGKRLDQTHLEALHQPDDRRYRIYQAIHEELPQCLSLEQLEEKLEQRGISVRYRRDPVTNERQGISFHLEDRSFKGSLVDPAYSFGKLEQTLALQQRQVQEQNLRLAQEQTLLEQVSREQVRQRQERLPERQEEEERRHVQRVRLRQSF
jgi:hypothetical protein